MAEIKLKTCPFCGGEAKVFKHKKAMASFGTLFSYEVECAYCFCRTGLYPSEEKAVNAWNRRKGRKGEPMEHKQPYCFRCEQFYREKGKRFPTAHCTFETYVRCIGRLRGEKPERRTE